MLLECGAGASAPSGLYELPSMQDLLPMIKAVVGTIPYSPFSNHPRKKVRACS